MAAERIKKGVYTEKPSPERRASLNGDLQAKAAERAKSSAVARAKARNSIYARRSQRAQGD